MALSTTLGQRAALLAAFALPAVAQSATQGSTLRTIASSSPEASPEVVAKQAYRELQRAIKEEQKSDKYSLEEYAGKKQFTVGRYPHRYEIVDRNALKKGVSSSARQLAAQSEKDGSMWVVVPAQRAGEPPRMNLQALQLAGAESFRVLKDPLERAARLGLIKLNGRSDVPVNAPFVEGDPFVTESLGTADARAAGHLSAALTIGPNLRGAGGNRGLFAFFGFTPPDVHRTWAEVSDTTKVFRPEFVRGELAGRNLTASSEGYDRHSGLVHMGGKITEKSLDITYRWERPAQYWQAMAEVDSKLGKHPLFRAAVDDLKRQISAKFPAELKSDKKRGERGYALRNINIFYGPSGNAELGGSEAFLSFVQRQIEIDSRNQLAQGVAAAVINGGILGENPEQTLQALSVAHLLRLGGARTSTAQPRLETIDHVERYLVDAAYGLTDDSLPDFRQLIKDFIRGSKGENERVGWIKIQDGFEKTVAALDKEYSKGDVDAALRSSSVKYPWSAFPFTLPADTVLAGMLYERLRIDT